MDDSSIGLALRTLRLRRGMSQEELSAATGVSVARISRVERRQAGDVRLDVLRRLFAAVEAHGYFRVRVQGGELDRLMDARHAAVEGVLVGRFAPLLARTVDPEVTIGRIPSVDRPAAEPPATDARGLPAVDAPGVPADDRPDRASQPPHPDVDRAGLPHDSRPTGWPAPSDLLSTAGPERLQHELIQAQKMEAIGQLVSGVAHELNNPLAAIIAFSQLIRHDPRLPEDLRHDADLLVQEADRTRRIVQNLLDFARQRPPERHPTALRPLVASIVDLQSYLIASSKVEVTVDIPGHVPLVPLDRAQMQQVLLNLTLNAVQAIRSGQDGPGGGHLRISADVDRPADGHAVARLRIVDDGPGVAPEHRPRLFVPFFTTKEPGEGTGLGLAVSFGIVAAHGGRLAYEPTDGGGATFVIELPLEPPPVTVPAVPPVAPVDPAPVASPVAVATREPGAVAGPSAAAGVPTADAPRPRVLVLDDEPSIRRFLSKALALAGCDAVLTETGPEAIEAITAAPFDAVLCDHRMAGMTGTDVYEAALAIRPELASRFVFMSGDVLNPDLRDFADSRGLALLAKPFELETVGRTVRTVMESTQRG